MRPPSSALQKARTLVCTWIDYCKIRAYQVYSAVYNSGKPDEACFLTFAGAGFDVFFSSAIHLDTQHTRINRGCQLLPASSY